MTMLRESSIQREESDENYQASEQAVSLEPRPNLIVNYLPQSLSDDEFRGLFMAIGPVKHSKVCRDKRTQVSFGFGFIEYYNVEEATKAIDTLNGHQLGTKRLKVAYARPNSDEIKKANLYFRALPKDWKEDDLRNLCEPYGDIIQVRILHDHQTGESKCTGFVLFNKKAEADSVISEINGRVLPGATDPCVVKVAENDNNKVKGVHPSPSLHNGFSSMSLHQPGPYGHFNQGGPMRGPRPGFRYNPMSASLKLSMYQNKQQASFGPPNGMPNGGGNNGGGNFHGNLPGPTAPGFYPNRMNKPPFQPRMPMDGSGEGGSPEIVGGHTLFVYNTGLTTQEKDLYELFSPFGAISRIDIVRDPNNNNSTKFAFIVMPNYQEAVTAISQLNGYNYTKRPLQVSLKK